MKQPLFLVAVFLICTFVSAQTNLCNQVRLPSGRYGEIISFDAERVICSVDTGKEVCGWLDLNFPLSCNIETNASIRFDQRHIKNKAESIIRTLISINVEGEKWHCYLIDHFDTDPVSHIKRKAQRQFIAYLGPAYFTDDDTILITPDYELIAFRDYNNDGKDEMFRAWRSTTTRNGQLIPESESYLKMPPRWTCTFKAWGNSYYFNFDQDTFPLIPEPNPKAGYVCWGENEYSLETLLIEDSDGLIRYPITRSNQRVDPTVKTPVESGKAQGTAGHP